MLSKIHSKSCVGTGFIVLDIIRNTGETTSTEKYFAGGSCGNVLSILSYFGWDTKAVGRIGDDQAGRALISDLGRWGVEIELLQIEKGRRTPIIVQENYTDKRGTPRHRFCRECPVCGVKLPSYRPLLLSRVDSIAAILSSHSVFYFDRVAPGIIELARDSRSKGAIVVFEPSGIKEERLFVECLKIAHVVKYANDRIQGVHDLVAQSNVPIEIETLGSSGLRLRVRKDQQMGSWIELPAFITSELHDTAGAGDWTTAGLIHTLFSTLEIKEHIISNVDAVVHATQFGQALAALNCGFEGARGLMNVADATSVLELATNIVNGDRMPGRAEVQLQTLLSGLSKDKMCFTCSNG